jgi:hypothetical protein
MSSADREPRLVKASGWTVLYSGNLGELNAAR